MKSVAHKIISRLKHFAGVLESKENIKDHFKVTSRINLKIVEGVASVYFYHLARQDSLIALCGETRIMPTKLPLSTWGYKSDHINERYCSKCHQKFISLQQQDGS